jgi:Cu2+-exporting ATPase
MDVAAARCLHCGLAAAPGVRFCCAGCEAAHGLIEGLGLGRYYQRRVLDPKARPLRPDTSDIDYDSATTRDEGGGKVLHLMVDGLHCAACVWLIEQVLARDPDVIQGRVNMTTRRLTLKWRGERAAAEVVAPVLALGYRLVPYDPALLDQACAAQEKELLRALAVAGFAAGNVMLLSISVWAGHVQGMGPATRDLLHWVSALIALPAIAYAGLPFFRSASGALAAGRVNMDVPISLGVVLAAGMSLAETVNGGPHAYFDSAVALLFFLLIGRYLDRRTRNAARFGVERLLALKATAVTVIDAGGARRILTPARVVPGMKVLAAAGERIAVDGTVTTGLSDVDTSLITGETVPRRVAPGDRVFAGTVNLGAPLTLDVTAAGESTLLAEIVRLTEAAEQGRARHVALADRVARFYAPVVHTLALATFLGWWLGVGVPWQQALLTAISVLIVTCPCALALAVPVVQVAANGLLLRQGILVKSATALERLAEVDTAVFDKTGTLTTGELTLADRDLDSEALALAASLAGASKHPLARALCRAAPGIAVAARVRETPGCGLAVPIEEGEARLGRRDWCGVATDADDAAPELWLARLGAEPTRFVFADRPRPDAAEVVAALKAEGFRVALLSGDRPVTARAVAAAVGIDDVTAGVDPEAKVGHLRALAAEGRRVVMVGDGLNDAPALAAAHASLSPASAADVAQTAADAVFQGARLAPVLETLRVARRSARLVKQNFALAFLYNIATVPIAVAGLVTPLIAAIAMSASSLVVIVNALRLGRGRTAWTRS